ncbi:MAG: M28 family peptidase [Ignavibacteriae bacterium]|nr:M28 family peptidase [Ignavibacteriota bacterium]
MEAVNVFRHFEQALRLRSTHIPRVKNLNVGLFTSLVTIFFFLLSRSAFAQPSDFSQESAAAILKTLVLDIGPRPMGSPAEQRALDFAVEKFRAYGCDSSFVMPMTVAEGVNTKSGVAVGVKKGKTGRIIVIGGHIDSSGPDVPGANDDGSGAACVIELARVLCQRESESTIYFCCWGGEEQGLEGSKFFVDHFDRIDSVALMLQIDMADGAGDLQADPDGSRASAPSWLVSTTFELFYDDVKSEGLVYPTEAATLNLASGGSWGSDHIPFIDKGIPAIDFTSDPAYPIHTPQDNWENFTPTGLKRSGDLVLRLFERYDRGVPSRSTESYQLIQLGSHLIFLPYSLLWAFIALAVVIAVVAFVIARRRRLAVDPAARVRWSRFKLFVAAFVIQTFIWISETIVGSIVGYRFPWVNNQAGYAILGTLGGLIGLWLVLRAMRRFRLSEDAYAYVPIAMGALFIATVLSSLVTPELGIFLAASLLFFSFALIIHDRVLKLILLAGSFLVAFNLLFFDGLELFQRLYTANRMSRWWQEALVHVVFISASGVLSLPFMHAFAAVYRSSSTDFFWLKKFRSVAGIVLTLIVFVAVSVYLAFQPSYDRKWFNDVRVEHEYKPGLDTSAIVIRGSEYFDGLSGSINGRDTTLSGRINLVELPTIGHADNDWLRLTRTGPRENISDSVWQLDRVLELHSRFRPLRVDVVYESSEPFEIESEWAHGPKLREPSKRESDKRKVFRWYSFPDTLLTIPITFTLRDSQQVSEFVEVVFDSVNYPINLKREFTNVGFRTTITATDTFAMSH